jgi:flagellar hook-basal body complex protein FliE
MAITPANLAAAAYNAVGRTPAVRPTPAGDAPVPTGGANFASLMRESAANTLDTLRDAERSSVQAVTGQADIGQVVTAIANAETSLQTAMAVRDRVIQAYNDIMRMPI